MRQDILIYPATAQQEGVYFHNVQTAEPSIWTKLLSWVLDGNLNVALFQKSVQKFLENESLYRTVFRLDNDRLMQVIFPLPAFDKYFEYVDISNLEEDKKEETLGKTKEDEKKQKFNLEELPLLRFRLLKLTEEKHILILSIHHIISDAVSSRIIQNQLMQYYSRLSDGEDISTKDEIKYCDYAAWQSEYRKSEDYSELQKYWKSRINGKSCILKLPGIAENSSSGKLKYHDEYLSFEDVNDIRNYCLRKRLVFSTPFLASLFLLLHKYTYRKNLLIGTLVNSRNNPNLNCKNTLGLFANKLVLETNIDDSICIEDYLKEINRMFNEAYAKREYLYEDLIRSIDVSYNNILVPLFNVVFNLIKIPKENNVLNGTLQIKKRQSDIIDEDIAVQYHLSLRIIDYLDEVRLRFLYSESTFSGELMDYFCSNYVNILKRCIRNGNTLINDIDYISGREKEKLIKDFNFIGLRPNSIEPSVMDLLMQNAGSVPDNLAVITNSGFITYRELHEKSNCLAAYLQAKGIVAHDTCAIVCNASINMVIGILGILKAGGTFLPVDPESPAGRVNEIINDSNAKALLYDNELPCGALSRGILKIDTGNIPDDVTPQSAVSIKPHGDDLIYIIYTSGSTGKPKGVKITHKNVANYVHWVTNEFKITEKAKLIATSSFAFDAVYTQFFCALAAGAELHVLSKDKYQDPVFLLNYIHSNNISFLKCTPSLLNIVLKEEEIVFNKLAGLKSLMVGGEKIKPNDIKKIMDKLPGIQCYNHYGPTETTIGSVACHIKPEQLDSFIETPVIGYPIFNTQVYIVDNNNHLVPVGVNGELCIAGSGVGKGYVNDDALTNIKFITNSFKPDSKLYKTGDIARWLPDGIIELSGRNDGQIKIRGFRIEKNEIETILKSYSGINNAVVNVFDNAPDESILCAYYTANTRVDLRSLKKYLEEKLPYYMLPSCYLQLEHFPLLQNNKVDLKSLPKPSATDESAEKEMIEELTETEKKIQEIWKDLLKKDTLSINDNFFLIGGHSLLAVKFVSELLNRHKLELTLKNVFSSPTVKELAALAKPAVLKNKVPVKKVNAEIFSLSPAQRRIFYLQQLNPENTDYNIPKAYLIEGELDLHKLENAFYLLLADNDILRTGFYETDGELMQKVHQSVDFSLEVRQIPEYSNTYLQELITPFNLAVPPLIKAVLLRTGDNKNILVLNIHHLISDAGSDELIINKLKKAYRDSETNRPGYQYIDYVNWLKTFDKDTYIKQKEFWLNVFKNVSQNNRLPYDFSVNDNSSDMGGSVEITIQQEKLNTLKKLSSEVKTTNYIILFAIYKIVLGKFTDSEDVTVGVPIDCRPYPEFSETIGLFINTLAIRSYPGQDKTFAGFVEELNHSFLKARENQDYPFEKLVNDLKIKRDINSNPLFDTFFNYLIADKITGGPGSVLNFLPVRLSKESSKFDIRVYVQEKTDRVNISFSFKSNRFKAETIEYLAGQYAELLDNVLLSPGKKLWEYGLFKRKRVNPSDKNNSTTGEPGINTDSPTDNILNLFKRSAKKYPDKNALEFIDRSVTYSELDNFSDAIAGHLINLLCEKTGNNPGTSQPILLYFDKGVEMIATIIGVTKTNNAYIPIDPNYPKNRVQAIIQETGAQIIFTNTKLSDQVNKLSGDNNLQIINTDTISLSQNKLTAEELNISNSDIAYILYTSGSTGKPKGICQSQRNLLFYVSKYIDALNIDSSDRISWLSDYTHDASVVDIFSGLLSGATVCVYNTEADMNQFPLGDWIERRKISIYHSVPSLYRLLINSVNGECNFISVRYVVLGGEAVSSDDFKMFKRCFPEYSAMINLYGATEATIVGMNTILWNTGRISSNVPIGRPFPELNISIVSNDREADVYQNGELICKSKFIAGYLSQNYLQIQPDLISKLQEERHYPTGDIVKLMADDCLSYQSRNDSLIKVKGNRISLFEIELISLQYEGVEQAAAVFENNSVHLFFTARENISTFKLRGYLRDNLTVHMMPASILQLQRMPYTSSGKIDKLALSGQYKRNTRQDKDQLLSDFQKGIAEIWKKYLEADQVKPGDSFFDLGGDSFKLLKLNAEIEKIFNIKLYLRDYYYFNFDEITQIVNNSMSR